MKKRLLTAAAVGAFLALPSVAAAQEGWYVRGALGYGAPGDADVTSPAFTANPSREISGKSNLREALAIGYQLDSNWRVEGELAHRFNQTGAMGNFEESTSSVHAWSLMASAIYDFAGSDWYRPYVGAGIGYVSSHFSGTGASTGTATAASVPVTIRGDDGALGYHLLAGIGWVLSENLMLDTEYRYFGYGSTSYNNGS
ncbi:MAG TPA: cell envelope biogenesis protein OmpA, partial [Oceanicaulis sp.]|nr:cell envelope biogenesis protein OmpA [Oceanicaulis sp.]